jgi:phosphate transport system permease protein
MDEIAMSNLSFDQRIKLHIYLDRLFRGFTQLIAIFVIILMGSLLFQLIEGSLPSLQKFGWNFFVSAVWDPITQQFGALDSIVGTLATAFIALLIGVPISFGIAIFLVFLCPSHLRQPLRISIELLAGIPSIIYGMWGLFVFVPLLATHIQPWLTHHIGPWLIIGPLFQGAPIGIGVLTAGIILGIMIIPFIAAVMRDIFEIVPDLLKESAYALGATTWEVIWKIVLPYVWTGVVGAIMLGLGRALGETVAVSFVIGNAHRLSASLLEPGNTLASVLANEFTEATGQIYTSSLIALCLVLFMITCTVILFSKILIRHLGAQKGT